jgi:superfamily II DNA or RNA helicase
MNFWKEYEHFIIKYHQDTYNHITYHWSNIPEEILYESGFINDTNKIRLQRKRDKTEGKINSIQEYGLDGIVKDGEIYHGIQAKCYDGKSYLKASDLGTFLSVLFLRMKTKNNVSKGYLYHTCKLESNLYDDLLINNHKDIIQKHLLYENHIQDIQNIKVNIINEKEELRYYQKEVIEKLQNSDWNGKKLIQMPCGTGKSTVIAHYLEKCDYEHIYIFSPLRVHAKQNLETMSKYISNYEKILVDCDKDGTRNIEYIKEKLNKKVLISSTYVSALDVINKIMEDQNILNKKNIVIVDEAHNLYEDLANVLDKFSKVILLTATPSEEMKTMIDCETLYKYNMDKAIEDKYICDYRIYLPYLEDGYEIPIEFEEYNKEIVAKVIYLVNGMLVKGCRRSIVYLKTVDECELFNEIFRFVMEEYHSLPYWCERINKDTSDKERFRILKEFESEKNRSDTLHILSSVRILDEGVNIVKCDSVFICGGNGSGNEIRTLQRMCRANRLDKDNKNKIAHCFMWCNEWSESLVLCSSLKEVDVEFSKKVSVFNVDYHKNCDQKVSETLIVESNKVKEYLKIKCKDINEKQMEKAIEIVKRAKLREQEGKNLIPKSYTGLKNLKNENMNDPKVIEHNDYLFLYYIKTKIQKYNKNIIEYLNINLPEWDLYREDKTMNNIKKLVERYLIRGFPKCISMKNAKSEEEKNDAFDYQLLQDFRKGKYDKNENAIKYLDQNIPNWRYKKDSKTLDEIAFNYAKEIVKYANIRKEKGLNFLPKNNEDSISELIKNKANKEIIIEKKHYKKLRHWKESLKKNKSSNSRCSDEVVKYLDENLNGWNDDTSLEEKALQKVVKIINRCKDREKNGKRAYPKSYKKHLRITKELEIENQDYQKLSELKKAYNGKGTTILYPSVKEYLDKNLPEWNE